MNTTALIVTVCVAQFIGMMGSTTFNGLLPVLRDEWGMSNTQGGLMSGIIFGVYALSVLVLVTATDRFQARRIYLIGVFASTVSHLGMAYVAHDFVTGMVFRAIAGFGWAGTYMVGLRVLTDELEGRMRSRGVAFHAAAMGTGGSLSFFLAGEIDRWLGWEAAFLVSAAGTAGAFLIALVLFPRREPTPSGTSPLADFRHVLRNRSAMAYITCYGVHTWEMFAVRSWAVAFLTFAAMRSGLGPEYWFAPTVVAMLMELLGTASSLAGNELAIRIGRQRWILLAMSVCMALACATGFISHWGYWAAAVLCIIYNMVIYADSAALTAGTIGASEPERRGATLAVHSLTGYGLGFVGAVVLGGILDVMGGESVLAWGVAFAHIALVMALGPLALLFLKPADLAGDRAIRAGAKRT